MHINPYALARFTFSGALVLSTLGLMLEPSWAWFSAICGWIMVLIYENVRRQLFRMLIDLKEQGLITIVRDDIDVNEGK